MLKLQVSSSRALSVNIYIFLQVHFKCKYLNLNETNKTRLLVGRWLYFVSLNVFIDFFFFHSFSAKSLAWNNSQSPIPCATGSFLYLACSKPSVSRTFLGHPKLTLGLEEMLNRISAREVVQGVTHLFARQLQTAAKPSAPEQQVTTGTRLVSQRELLERNRSLLV